MIKYIKVNGTGATHLKVEIDYNKGGYNYFTYKTEPRGYYIHVSPVTRNITDTGFVLESYTAFTGIKACLLEVTRKSNKAENQAIELFELKKDKYIDYILEKNNLTLEV